MINIIIFLFIIDSILSEEYELYDGIAKNFTGFKELKEYAFFIKVTQSKIINLSLYLKSSIMDFNSDFFRCYMTEYTDRYSTSYNKRKYINYESKRINNEKVSIISYKVLSSSTNYVFFQFEPFIDIYYIFARFDIIDEMYDLYNGISKTISYLEANKTFYFYEEIFQGQKADFNITMNYMSLLPFSNIDIYEYEGKDMPFSKNIRMPISFTSKDNKLSSTFSYIVSSNSIKYISLKIRTSYDINYMNIKFEIPIVIVDLDNSISKTVNDLIFGKKYLFFIYATLYSKVKISFNTNKTTSNKPFSSAYIYEYEERNDSYSSFS